MLQNKIFSIIIVAHFFLHFSLFASNTQQMIIRLNGHDYQVDDIFSKKVKEMYNEKKSEIQQDIQTEIMNTQPDASVDLSNIK